MRLRESQGRIVYIQKKTFFEGTIENIFHFSGNLSTTCAAWPGWATLVPSPLQHLHWPRKKQKPKAEGGRGKGGSGGGAGEGVKRVEKEEMWEFVSG